MNLTHQDQDFPEWLLLYVARSLGGNYDTSFVKHPRGTSRASWPRNRAVKFVPPDGCCDPDAPAFDIVDIYMEPLEVRSSIFYAHCILVAYDEEENILHWAIP